jgi:hypothetical protein
MAIRGWDAALVELSGEGLAVVDMTELAAYTERR